MKTFKVNGVRVIIFPGNLIKIFTISRAKADKVRKYLRDEGLSGGAEPERNDKEFAAV